MKASNRIKKVRYQSDFFNQTESSRSDKYQYLIREISWDDTALTWFSNQDGIYGQLSPYQYNENVLSLRDQLTQRVYRLAKSVCTDRQFAILRMMADGYTQVEMAELLGLGQSTITKTIHGSQFYDSDGNKIARYGGLMKKVKKAVAEDPEIQTLLKNIAEFQEEIL